MEPAKSLSALVLQKGTGSNHEDDSETSIDISNIIQEYYHSTNFLGPPWSLKLISGLAL
jgi:hypothetical protein